MRKVLATIFAIMLFGVSVHAVEFTDITGHWAEWTIRALTERGVINGMTDISFEPDGAVTRAQYLKMIMEATGIATVNYRQGECLEAKDADWYSPYLQSALDKGLVPHSMITGFRENVIYSVDENGKATDSKVVYQGAFNGDLPITREEMAVLTEYCHQYTRTVLTNKAVDRSSVKKFKDQADISEWAQNSVMLACANGFIEGMDDAAFCPKENATRAQAATIILRVING